MRPHITHFKARTLDKATRDSRRRAILLRDAYLRAYEALPPDYEQRSQTFDNTPDVLADDLGPEHDVMIGAWLDFREQLDRMGSQGMERMADAIDRQTQVMQLTIRQRRQRRLSTPWGRLAAWLRRRVGP